MTDFLYRFDNAINIDINLAICLVGITGLLALLAPLSAWEMRNNNNSNQSLTAGCGFVKLLTASLTAWIVDAALFAVPAMTLVALVHIFPMQLFGSSRQMPFTEDLTGNPASLLIKCFMVALNPFWFVVVQLLGFTGEQSYPYRGTFGQSLRVSIEAAVPLALFLCYQVLLNGSKFKGTVGTLLVDHLNQVPVHTTSVVGLIIDFFKSALFGLSKVFAILRHNGHQSNSQNLYPSPALTTARKNRWFVVALSSFFFD